MRFALWVVTTGTLIFVGCTARAPGEREQPRAKAPAPSEDITEKTGSTKHPLSPEDSFEVKLPTSANWETLHRGQLGDRSDTFALAIADVSRSIQLTVTVLPAIKDAPTLQLMKADWEKGFLKKATRKISSEDTTISGKQAYKAVAALDADDGSKYEIVGILVMAEGHVFTIGTTTLGENVVNEPEVREFIDSFRIVEGQP